jgi:hypothetical protein
MQCPACGKTGFVIISNKRYCSNCGSKLPEQAGPRAISDIKPSAAPSAPQTAATQPVAPRPAAQFHGREVPNKAGMLDLRPTAAAAVTPPAAPAASPAPAAVPPATAPPAITPLPSPASKAGVPPVPPSAAPQPAAPTTAPASSGTHPLVQRFPQHPAVATASAAAAAPSLPNAVATQVDAMKLLTEPATDPAPTQPKSPALREALAAAKPSATPNIIKVGAALTAIAIMGGFVWLQNSPKLAFRSAAAKAGIDASLPTYVPSSYRQTGPATVAPGQLSLAFTSPDNNQLQITQRRTEWDSNSLRENFVGKQSDNYLAIQGQGLTIYLYNDAASWVNHGVWYTVSGTAKLSREQVLKIAYGL